MARLYVSCNASRPPLSPALKRPREVQNAVRCTLDTAGWSQSKGGTVKERPRRDGTVRSLLPQACRSRRDAASVARLLPGPSAPRNRFSRNCESSSTTREAGALPRQPLQISSENSYQLAASKRPPLFTPLHPIGALLLPLRTMY